MIFCYVASFQYYHKSINGPAKMGSHKRENYGKFLFFGDRQFDEWKNGRKKGFFTRFAKWNLFLQIQFSPKYVTEIMYVNLFSNRNFSWKSFSRNCWNETSKEDSSYQFTFVIQKTSSKNDERVITQTDRSKNSSFSNKVQNDILAFWHTRAHALFKRIFYEYFHVLLSLLLLK